MYFISTRDKTIRMNLADAIVHGLAPDGGLFVPEHFPAIQLADFSADLTYPDFAAKLLQLFADDFFAEKFATLCKSAFTFPLPLTQLNANTYMLELFHGPTSSFKDFGARFLAECLNVIAENHKTTVMVATSGDTGSAVASAFYKKPNIDVIVLFPKGQISARQEHQITCWGNNVQALAVDGSFDHCQALVKKAFQDPWWQQHLHLSSANSINIGRLLPQMTYYAYTSVQYYQKHNTMLGFIVPTGNLGNATAAYWAKTMGFPIREIVLASNANTVIEDFLQTGEYQPRPSIATLANAMDVGNPSNFERLQNLFPQYDELKQNVSAFSAKDTDICDTIKTIYRDYHTIICPHTATAFFARNQLSEAPWVIVATADPSKFENIIEPIIGKKIPIAPQLQQLLERRVTAVPVIQTLEDIKTKGLKL